MGLDEALAAARQLKTEQEEAELADREAFDAACRRFAQLAADYGVSTSRDGGWTVGPIQVLEDGTWLHQRVYLAQHHEGLRNAWEKLEETIGKEFLDERPLDVRPSVEFIEEIMVKILMEASESTAES